MFLRAPGWAHITTDQLITVDEPHHWDERVGAAERNFAIRGKFIFNFNLLTSENGMGCRVPVLTRIMAIRIFELAINLVLFSAYFSPEKQPALPSRLLLRTRQSLRSHPNRCMVLQYDNAFLAITFCSFFFDFYRYVSTRSYSRMKIQAILSSIFSRSVFVFMWFAQPESSTCAMLGTFFFIDFFWILAQEKRKRFGENNLDGYESVIENDTIRLML